MNVILNVVKNLLGDNTLLTLSRVGCEEIATACSKPRNDGVQHQSRKSKEAD